MTVAGILWGTDGPLKGSDFDLMSYVLPARFVKK